MALIDLLTGPWAIVPDRLLELQAIYATHLRGDKIDIDAIEARLGRPLANDQKAYQLQEGTSVAVLEVSGVISPKANLMTRVSGGASASELAKQVNSMAADPKVKAALINWDTPGGNVLGIPALGAAIAALAAAKPTVSVSTGNMCSAGYWAGCAANAVYIGGLTDVMGSIGVVASHSYDPRSADVQTTEVTAGKYKRVASDRAPLSAEGRAYLQSQVDEIYRVMVDQVAGWRGASVEDVLSKMADGRVFIGQQALDAGLADGVATVDQLVEQLATDPARFAARRRAVFASPAVEPMPTGPAAQIDPLPTAAGPVLPEAPTPGVVTMTPQEMAAKFAAESPDAAALLRVEGSSAERERIQAVRAQAIPGHEALIEGLAFDGVTSGPEAAVKVLAAERTRIAGIATARAKDAPAPVAQAASDAASTVTAPAVAASHAGFAVEATSARLDAQAKAYMAAHPGTAYIAAIKAVQQTATQGA